MSDSSHECSLSFHQISHQQESQNSSPAINCSLVIKNDCTWQIHVHGHCLPQDSPVLAEHPSVLNSTSAALLLSGLSHMNICPGNPEEKFTSIAATKRNGEFLSASSEIVAYLDKNGHVTMNGQMYTSTVRTTQCHLFSKESRCLVCTKYRKSLLVQHSRIVQTPANTSNKVNYRLVGLVI